MTYNAQCLHCGNAWPVKEGSSHWWQAKKHEEAGYIDAVCVDPNSCPYCGEGQKETDAPFRVFGFDWEFQDFDYPCSTFVQAVQTYRRLNNGGNVLMITGVSSKVEARLSFSF